MRTQSFGSRFFMVGLEGPAATMASGRSLSMKVPLVSMEDP
jgi:hypothetical protein